MQTCGVDKGHFSHTDNTYLGSLTIACHDVLETVTGTEEIRTVDLIHLHMLGDGEMFEVSFCHVSILVQVDLVDNGAYLCGLCHSSHKEQTGTDESYLNGDSQIEDNGEEESEQ